MSKWVVVLSPIFLGAFMGLGGRPAEWLSISALATTVILIALRRTGDAGRVVLQLNEGMFSLRRGQWWAAPPRGKVVLRASLEHLREVKIDTYSVGQSRIVFLFDKRAPFYLTERVASSADTMETFVSIRRFFRAQGWLPHDERGEGADEDGALAMTIR